MKVAIGIATYKREKGLSDLLTSLNNSLVNFELVIVVGDNEGASHITKSVVDNFRNVSRFETFLLPVPLPGISNVRNELVNFSFLQLSCDFLAMIDDDEIADKYWIKNLVDSILTTSANVVGGNVLPRFDDKPPSWISKVDLYYRPVREKEFVSRIYGAGNFIMDKSCLSFSIKFDPEFSFTGGEDNDFFYRLSQRGCKFFYDPNAITYEHYPAARLSKKWAVNRAYRIGKIDARIKIRYENNISCFIFFSKAMLAIPIYSTFLLFNLFIDNNMKYALKLFRQFGKITGVVSRPANEYGK